MVKGALIGGLQDKRQHKCAGFFSTNSFCGLCCGLVWLVGLLVPGQEDWRLVENKRHVSVAWVGIWGLLGDYNPLIAGFIILLLHCAGSGE